MLERSSGILLGGFGEGGRGGQQVQPELAENLLDLTVESDIVGLSRCVLTVRNWGLRNSRYRISRRISGASMVRPKSMMTMPSAR